MRGISEHVDVKEFGDIAATPRVVLLAKRRPNVRAFLLHDRPLLRRCWEVLGGTRMTLYNYDAIS